MSERKTTKRFADTLSPGESTTLSETVDADATLENVQIRFYQGTELELEVFPYRKRESEQLALIDTNGKKTITGDNDTFEFDISEGVNAGDEIGVEVTNNGAYAYDFAAHIDVDYKGGSNRIINLLGGLFS